MQLILLLYHLKLTEWTILQDLQSEIIMHAGRTRTERSGAPIWYPPSSCGTNDSHREEEKEKGSEPLIGTIFSSGKESINRGGPKSETERERVKLVQ